MGPDTERLAPGKGRNSHEVMCPGLIPEQDLRLALHRTCFFVVFLDVMDLL